MRCAVVRLLAGGRTILLPMMAALDQGNSNGGERRYWGQKQPSRNLTEVKASICPETGGFPRGEGK
jgi:hypothetical protein